jgi:hypothetical protein
MSTSDSPGPCFNEWIAAYEKPLPRPDNSDLRTIKSLDINSPSSGFLDFVVPKEQYDNELLVQKDCEKEMEATIGAEQKDSKK